MDAGVGFESHRYIVTHCSRLAHPTVSIPLFPLGHSHEINHVWSVSCAVSNCGLFVVGIQQKSGLIFLDILGLGYELGSEGEEVSQSILGDVRKSFTLVFLFNLLCGLGLFWLRRLFLSNQLVEGVLDEIHEELKYL